MARITPLWRSSDISIHRFNHPAEDGDPPYYEETAERFSASFVETGSFTLEIGEGRWRVEAGDVFLNYPGLRFRAGPHDGATWSDVCFTVVHTGADVVDAARSWARAGAPVLPASNRLRYLYWGFSRAAANDAPLLADGLAADLFRAVPESKAERPDLYSERKLSWYAERVHAARERMENEFEREHRLNDLARDAGMSTFHFARVFTDLIGVAPHKLLIAIRLKAGARMLRDGRSVTDACYACGFNNLSHFSRAFSRRFGVSPSTYVS